ncbi:hypothetical protein ACLKA6_010518 [Drosophila palustris]
MPSSVVQSTPTKLANAFLLKSRSACELCWLLAAPNAEPQTALNVGCGPRYDYPSVAALRLPASGELSTF